MLYRELYNLKFSLFDQPPIVYTETYSENCVIFKRKIATAFIKFKHFKMTELNHILILEWKNDSGAKNGIDHSKKKRLNFIYFSVYLEIQFA